MIASFESLSALAVLRLAEGAQEILIPVVLSRQHHLLSLHFDHIAFNQKGTSHFLMDLLLDLFDFLLFKVFMLGVAVMVEDQLVVYWGLETTLVVVFVGCVRYVFQVYGLLGLATIHDVGGCDR